MCFAGYYVRFVYEVSLADVGVVVIRVRSHIYFCGWACFFMGGGSEAEYGGELSLYLHACFFFRILDQRSNFID